MIRPEDVTVIVPHLGNSEEQKYALECCLASLWGTSSSPIIVSANGNNFPDWILKSGRTRLLRSSIQGQCQAVNTAIERSLTPWLFVTNDDMIFPPDWLNKLSIGVVNHAGKGVRCISPKLVEPRPGAPTFEVYFCGGAGGDFDYSKFIQHESVRTVQTVDLAVRNGFNLPFLITRELWDLIGGYDEAYDPFGSNSDSDLLYKIRLAGVQPQQNQNCLVYHFSQTSGTFHPENHDYWQNNWEYFREKWGFYRTDDHIWEADFHLPTKEEGRVFAPEWEGHYGPADN